MATQDDKTSPPDESQEQYCEYICSQGHWSLIGANITSSDCSCPGAPAQEADAESDGYRITVEPECSVSTSSSDEGKKPSPEASIPAFHYAQYAFFDLGDGNFELRLRRANCPEGYHAPSVITKKQLMKNGIVTFPKPIRRYFPGPGFNEPWRQS